MKRNYPLALLALLTLAWAANTASAGTAYTSAVGAPPDPRTYAFYKWVDDLVGFRIAEAPIARSTSLYFSQSGDDITGDGSVATPWKTIAKAQSYHDTTGVSDYALLFKAGEVWAESTGLNITDTDVTVASYGVGVRPLIHCFTNTIASGGAAWANAVGDRYTIATTQVGQIRDSARRLEPYAALGSTGAVESNPRSWYWDGATLHINAGSGIDPNDNDYEWMGDVADDGINASGDGVRIHGIRFDGFGSTKGTGHQFYGIKASPIGTDAVVVSETENYYSGLSATSQYTTAAAGGIATFINCTAGYVNRTFSAANIFNGYSASGGHEYVNIGGTARFGYLPDTTLPAGGADLSVGIDAVAGDTSSGLASLVIVGDLVSSAETSLGNATWCDSRVVFNPAKLPAAAAITDARCFVYGVRSTHRQNSAGHLMVPPNTVVLDSEFDLVLAGTAEVLTTDAARKISGWAYNSVWKFTDTLTDKRRDFGPSTTGQVGTFVNCLIQVDGPGTLAGTKWQFTNTSGGASGVSLTSTVLVNLGSRPLEPGVNNSAVKLKNLATYSVLQSGSAGVDQCVDQVILDNPPSWGVVMDDSPLYRAGLAGLAVRVERDLLARPRDPVAPSIGPWEHAYRSGESAAVIARIDSISVIGVNVNQISGAAAAADKLEAILDGLGGEVVFDNTGQTTNLPADAKKINGSAVAADGVQKVFDGTGAPIKLMATEVGGAALTIENVLSGGHGVLINHIGGGATFGLTIQATGGSGTAITLNDGTDVGIGGGSALTGVTDAVAAAILTTPANTLTTDASGNVSLTDIDGIPDLKRRELALASLAGKTTLTDNGDGTKTLRFFKQNGTTPIIDITYNTSGEWTATEIDPAP